MTDAPATTEVLIENAHVMSGTDLIEEATPSERLAGLTLIGQGLVVALLGFGGLWLSFRFGDRARTILGAGPLFGGGMVGAGLVQVVFGSRLRPLRWVFGVVGAFVFIAATLLALEVWLGVTLA